MEVILSERKCRECGVRLTQFEIEEKQGYCMECSRELEEDSQKGKS